MLFRSNDQVEFFEILGGASGNVSRNEVDKCKDSYLFFPSITEVLGPAIGKGFFQTHTHILLLVPRGLKLIWKTKQPVGVVHHTNYILHKNLCKCYRQGKHFLLPTITAKTTIYLKGKRFSFNDPTICHCRVGVVSVEP